MTEGQQRSRTRRSRFRPRFRRERIDPVEEAAWLGGCCALDGCLTLALAGLSTSALVRVLGRRLRESEGPRPRAGTPRLRW